MQSTLFAVDILVNKLILIRLQKTAGSIMLACSMTVCLPGHAVT